MACSPMLFIQRARQHFGAADLRKYLGEAKVYPAQSADIVAAMVAQIKAEREVTVTRAEYDALWRLEAALREPVSVENPIAVNGDALARELFAEVVK